MRAREAAANAAAERRVRVAVVDYGAGNLVSIEQALLAVGAEPTLVRDTDALRAADALIVPGVGAAAPAMRRLTRARLVEPIIRWISAGRPFLGICLGLQLLFERSEEDGADTLGVLAGRTIRLDGAPTLPHIGWNQVVRRREHLLFGGLGAQPDLYFVHSYVGLPEGVEADRLVLADTEHGAWFPSVIERGNVLGVQFHPERSGADGLRLLANFVRWSGALAAGAGSQYAPVGAGGTSGGD